jgi:hypothetical protein
MLVARESVIELVLIAPFGNLLDLRKGSLVVLPILVDFPPGEVGLRKLADRDVASR